MNRSRGTDTAESFPPGAGGQTAACPKSPPMRNQNSVQNRTAGQPEIPAAQAPAQQPRQATRNCSVTATSLPATCGKCTRFKHGRKPRPSCPGPDDPRTIHRPPTAALDPRTHANANGVPQLSSGSPTPAGAPWETRRKKQPKPQRRFRTPANNLRADPFHNSFPKNTLRQIPTRDNSRVPPPNRQIKRLQPPPPARDTTLTNSYSLCTNKLRNSSPVRTVKSAKVVLTNDQFMV